MTEPLANGITQISTIFTALIMYSKNWKKYLQLVQLSFLAKNDTS